MSNNGSSAVLWMNQQPPVSQVGRNLYLSGFMGCGKSTVGALLAKRLGLDFVDLDRLIESHAGMSLSRLFQEKGEQTMRQWESELLKTVVAHKSHQVVSLGGGTLLREDNRRKVSQTGLQIYLRATLATLKQRIAQSPGTRPLLTSIPNTHSDPSSRSHRVINAEESMDLQIQTLLEARKPFYEQAQWVVDTDGRTPEQIVEQILSLQGFHASV